MRLADEVRAQRPTRAERRQLDPEARQGEPQRRKKQRQVERGKPEFASEMQSYLSSYYDLNLKPVGK